MPEPEAKPLKHPMLSQGAHEIRNPTAVVLGYIRMLTSGRMGPITDAQRKVLDEMAVSAGRLAALAEDMSFLGQLMAGGVELKTARVELGPLLEELIPAVPPVPDRATTIRAIDAAPGAATRTDSTLMRKAMTALLFAHRRELVSSGELCVALDRDTNQGQPSLRVTIAGSDLVDELRTIPLSSLAPFIEFRGGIGFTLSIACEVIVRSGGEIVSKIVPRENPNTMPQILGAVLILPEA